MKNPILYNLFYSFGLSFTAEIEHTILLFEPKIYQKIRIILDFIQINDILYSIGFGVLREVSMKVENQGNLD